ncbi:MAG: DUF2508 family protein [Syntrophomonadaceae bacterium]
MWTCFKRLAGKVFNLMIIEEPGIDTRQYTLEAMLEETRDKLKCAHNRFAIADDPDLIDSAIYMIKAEEKRFDYILKQVKQANKQSSLISAVD